jgi:predicted ABC-type transport system involved in lysophospholipase L1 biosynthesis ATPase subunit
MMEKMSAILKVEDVHKTYVIGKAALHVLKGVNFEVADGEKVAIVGLSGAGKSTLLHIIGGLDKPDEFHDSKTNTRSRGKVLVTGEDIYGLSDSRRTRIRATSIGFVFQSYHLLPEMDVLENVVLPAMAGRSVVASYGDMRARAMKLLESVGLADRADHTPLELSGGEQQRVALARALMNNPKLILADEPTGNLDGATGGQVLDNLFSLAKDQVHTLVLVTHNEQIARSCDRVFRLRDGVLQQA